jgi:2-methylisocitrate lyase-like PEP mutase family enzyme
MLNNPRNAHLKHLLNTTRTLAAPAAFDALSAKLVEEAGFPIVYIGSYGTAASAHGLADVGALSIQELVMHARAVARAVKVPVIADAEGGAEDPANVWRTVQDFEDAGVSAIHIEDHAGGKHTNLPQQLIPLDKMLAKLRAALDARRDPHFQIIARTDAIWATKNVEEARRRARAFAEAGVDMVFPCGADVPTANQIREELGAKVAVIETPTGPAHAASGSANLVINYGFCLYAATKGIVSALREYKKAYRAADALPLLEDEHAFEARFGYEEFSERSKRLRGG